MFMSLKPEVFLRNTSIQKIKLIPYRKHKAFPSQREPR